MTYKRRMTPEDFKDALQRVGFGTGVRAQEEAGRWLSGGARTGQRYALGESHIPRSTAMLLGLMIRLGLKREDVDAVLALEPEDK